MLAEIVALKREEGAALAVAVLEALRDRGVVVVGVHVAARATMGVSNLMMYPWGANSPTEF